VYCSFTPNGERGRSVRDVARNKRLDTHCRILRGDASRRGKQSLIHTWRCIMERGRIESKSRMMTHCSLCIANPTSPSIVRRLRNPTILAQSLLLSHKRTPISHPIRNFRGLCVLRSVFLVTWICHQDHLSGALSSLKQCTRPTVLPASRASSFEFTSWLCLCL
jgi:hypothetical protein